jgi:ATP synthase F1 delta subunit
MQIDNIRLAHQYARAFINKFYEYLTDADIEQINQLRIDLLDHKKKIYAIGSILTAQSAIQLFRAIRKHYNLSEDWQRLLELLYEKNRLGLLPEILNYIMAHYTAKKNRIIFNVKSPYALDQKSLQAITCFLEQHTRKHIILKPGIDKNLIAGIKIYNNNLGWEYSIRKQLSLLKSNH